MRDICSYACPQTWLNEARTNMNLSSTMGFLNENDSLAHFAILGELSSLLLFTVGIFKTFKFSLAVSWLFQGAKNDIPCNTLMF